MTRSILVAALLLSGGPTAVAQPGAPQPLSIEGAVPHVYKSVGSVDLRLHVFNPSGRTATPSVPAIVLFFGGGWTAGSITQFVPQARHLASRGMVAIVADYRVATRHQTTPFEAMADAKSAIRWIRNHTQSLGVDPDRLAAGGGSSGGHLALSAGVFDAFDEPGENARTSAKPNALVLFNPSVNPRNELFAGRQETASPLHHVGGGLAPTIIMHGRADTTVPYSDVEQFCAAARKHGNACTLIGYDEANHGFFNQQVAGGKWFRETLLEADRFLTSLGFLPEPAPAQNPR
jgi:acetyl esterase